MNIDRSDLLKILDALELAARYHQRRDEMNAANHLAEKVRPSPITSVLCAAIDRGQAILREPREQNEPTADEILPLIDIDDVGLTEHLGGDLTDLIRDWQKRNR